jgi:WD40 repeat protein
VDTDKIWAELASDTRAAIGWAAAMEPLDVGTRTMLVGILRAGGRDSDPEQLLRVMGCPRSRLFDALQEVAPRPTIRPYVSDPAQLDAMPALSPNGARVLERAVGIRDGLDLSSPVTSQHLFAAMLDFRRSTAYRGLHDVLNVNLGEIKGLYFEHLRSSDELSFRERLLRRYPDQGVRAGTNVLTSHRGAVNCLAFSADGGELASLGSDGTVVLWQLSGGRDPQVLTQHSDAELTAIAYSPVGRYLAYGTSKGAVWFWQRNGMAMDNTHMTEGEHPIRAIAFAPNGLAAVVDAGGNIVTRDAEIEPLAHMSWLSSDPGGLTHVAFSPDSERIVTADEMGTLALWNPHDGKMLEAHHSGAGTVLLDIGFAPDNGSVVFIREDGSVSGWELDSATMSDSPALAGRRTTVAALSYDGGLLATCHEDDTIRLRQTRNSREAPRALGSHIGSVRSLAVSTEANLVASGGDEGEIQLWPTSRGHDDVVDWQPDSPAQGVEADELGRRQLAVALAKRLQHIATGAETTEESFLLHIDGPWGVGKSTILGLLEKQLCEENDDWLIVRFDAWRQSRVGPPWWALLTSLRAAQGRALGRWGRARLRAAETLHRLRQYWISYLISLAVLAAALTAFLLLGPVQGSVAGTVQLISAAIAIATTVWVLARTAARSFMWESATAAKLYEQSHHEPMESLAKHFAWLMGQSMRRTMFFIDDLDRCDAAYVVDLLDSIQTLVRDAPSRAGGPGETPYFAIAADGRWIRCSYEHVYATFEDAVHEPGRPLGYLFLDKIFQLTVQVPMIGAAQQRSYFDHLLQRLSEPEAGDEDQLDRQRQLLRQSQSQEEVLDVVNSAPAAVQPELRATAVEQLASRKVARTTEHELQKFAALLEPNPRSMKRFINAYSVALSTALLEERRPEPSQLALWTIVRMRWPDLAGHLALNPQLIRDLAVAGTKAPPDTPENLVPLIGDPTVTEVVTFGNRPLDESGIRGLCGTYVEG